MKVGLVGCGAISEVYLSCSEQFGNFKIVKCADLVPALARKRAEQFHLTAVSLDELFADPELAIILNLTPPQAHTALNLRALEAGKHVYCEKVFALTMEDAKKVFRKAGECGLYAASAPDSFLGASQQYARELTDQGVFGRFFGGTASIMNCVGFVSDHPNIDFFFRKGGGPLMDMGAYYFSALCSILGPAVRVGCMGGRLDSERICIAGKSKGKRFPVEVDTHLQGIVEFACGAVVTLNTSFDVRAHSNPRIELYGSRGTLRLPEPSGFGKSVFTFTENAPQWEEKISPYGYGTITRGLGIAELADAIEHGREPRCSATFAMHVLEILCAMERSCAEKRFIELETTCSRPAPMPRTVSF